MSESVPSAPDPLELAYRDAILLHRRGFLRAAEKAFRKLLEQSPNNFQLLANLGWVFQDRSRWSEAEQLYRQSLEENQSQAWVHNHLAMVLFEQGQGEEALSAVRTSLTIKPDFGLAWLTLGRIHDKQRDWAGAADAFAQAFKWLPNSSEAALGLGSTLYRLGRYDEASKAFDQVLVIEGNNVNAWVGKALARQALGDHSRAIDDFNRALELKPDDVAGHAGLGLSLLWRGRTAEAWAESKRALALDESAVMAWVVRGMVQRRNGQPQEALAALSRALSLDPQQPLALWQSAYIKLLLGDYEQGWAASLWAARAEAESSASIPLLQGGDDLAGRALLVTHVETQAQVLQYSRFLPLLAEQAASVTLRVPDDCQAMAQWALPASIRVVALGDAIDDSCDAQLPLLAVPAFLGLQQPVPPLVPVQAPLTWAQPLQGDGPGVGVYWGTEATEWAMDAGAPPLSALRSLLELPHTFHLLKSSLTDEERALVADLSNVILHEGELETPMAMAALLDQCGLVICPDSALAHMAATMGKPTWVMLPAASAHVWQHDRSDTPWYPGVTLYRKPDGADWGAVIRPIKKQLPFLLHATRCESEGNRFVPDLTYDLSQYDEHGCLLLNGSQKLIMLFLGRGFWLPMFASFVSSKGNKPGAESVKGSMDFILHGSKHPLLELACALPVVLLVFVLFKRKPESGRLMRRLWAWGPWLLLLSAVADFTLRVVTVRWGGSLGMAPFWLLIDTAIGIHIFSSSRLRDVFKDFPAPRAVN
jgi:tetratricopeptide (TPR) repeat protein